jgi:signal transduction histidine kinase
VGSVLRGKYRLDEVLGIGGMAVVYAATHRNQKQFAVKVLHPELSLREGIRARFLREGYAANSVKHPGAVAVMDDDVAEDGAAFLVMELLEGMPVEEVSMSCGRISVKDHGIGMAEADTHRIFDRFERVVSTRHYGGLGLGLYLAREIIEAHNGSILVSTEPGVGSTFRIVAPAGYGPTAVSGTMKGTT